MPNVGNYSRHGFRNTLTDNDLNEASVDVTKKGGGGGRERIRNLLNPFVMPVGPTRSSSLYYLIPLTLFP